MKRNDVIFYILFLLIVVIAFFLRVYHLDERVFHHDEAAVGYYTYKLFNEGVYSYDPAFHGPFMYYVTTEIYKILGDSDYSSRFIPALLGGAILFLLLPLKKYIGKNGILFSGFFIAFSPSLLYYSRFYREDIFIAFFSLLMFVCILKYKEKSSPLKFFYLLIGAFSLASLAALKENAYITIALLLFFFFLLFIKERKYENFIARIKLNKPFILELVFFISVFLIGFSIYYTGKFFEISGMADAVIKAISHWYEMHKIERIGGPFWYYIPILTLYELPILIFGIAGIIYYYKNNDFFMTFISYWAVTNFMVYSYLQEKVPWLVLNILLPLILISGTYVGEMIPKLKLNSKHSIFLILFLVLSSSFFVYSSLNLNYKNYTNPAEPLVQASQPPQKFTQVLNTISNISSQYNNSSTPIQVTDNGVETQFLWYLRHYKSISWGVSLDTEFTAPLIVVHDTDGDVSDADIVKRRLKTDYERLNSAKMSWYWFKPSDVTLDYVLYRKMDRSPSEYRIVLYYQPKEY